MKKLLIGVFVIGVLGVGIYALTKLQLRNPWLDGEREKVKRGDMVIPVTANGVVEPNQFILIKSKAGGQVKKIHVVEGQKVKKGDILVELDPVDEDRNVAARRANLARLKSAWEKAKIAKTNAEKDLPLQTKETKAKLADAQARLTNARKNHDRMERLSAEVKGDVEVWGLEMAFETAQAQVDMLKVDLERAINNESLVLDSAREDVVQAEEAFHQAEKDLDEANQRQKETVIKAASDAMVYRVDIRGSEMIQSGTQSFTGGTAVMMLADTSAMFVIAQVDEADIGMIRDIAPDFAKPGQTRRLENAEAMDYARRVIDTDTSEKTVDSEANAKAVESSATIQALTGRPVDVTVDAYRSQTYKGIIERILPEPQTLNNVVTFKVRIRLVGDDLEKLLGTQADLSFTTRKISDALLVKNDALFSEGKDCFVYVPKRAGDRGPWDEEKVPVKIGSTDGTFTEVLHGLNDNQEVWTKRPKKTEKEKESSKA